MTKITHPAPENESCDFMENAADGAGINKSCDGIQKLVLRLYQVHSRNGDVLARMAYKLRVL